MGSFRYRTNAARVGALLVAALVAAPALARSECENLPNLLKLDSGRIQLQRDGDFWKLVKGRIETGAASPLSFIYLDHDDYKHIYRFIYRTENVFSCEDTARYA